MGVNRLHIESVNISNILAVEDFNSIPIKQYSKGNIVYGGALLKLVIIKSGKAKAIIYEDDDEFILYYLSENNIIIPEESCAVEFLEDSEVYEMDAELFSDFFKNEKFSSAIISSLKQRAVMERKIIKNLVFKTCKNRVASFLLDLMSTQGTRVSNQMHITLDLSIKELASFIGAKRQTVSTVFHELINENIIEKIEKNEYIIHNIKKLKEYRNTI